MNAVVFPGQGSQSIGMGKEDFESSELAQSYYEKADDILGFSLSEIMFNGSEEDLKQTKVTQPAVFLYSIVRYYMSGKTPDVVAGHSLGEFTALVAAGVLKFEDALSLVSKRANAMQVACDQEEGTMAAVLGLEDKVVEEICHKIEDVVVAANYNCPGQLVISGSKSGIDSAVTAATEAGARRALVLNVGGAFHSPLMGSAEEVLASAIESTEFHDAKLPIYQNVNGMPQTDASIIKQNLIKQLTSPVKWTQTMQGMIADGLTMYTESGAKVLSGFIKRVDRKIPTEQI